VKRSKRERKISKVMGEFKDGSLKSGGSGRKVTNPKQAIAIALSEAEGMNQGGIVSLAQTGSPFTNSIRPRRQTNMGPRSIAPMQQRGFQSPMQRNFMQLQNQMQSMQQNPLELYQGYLGQKYIGPMQQEQQDKISQFVGAVNQAERQVFGGQQDGKTFGGRLQPGMPGLGLQNQPAFLQPTNQAPDVMPPMNQAPDVMPQQLQPLRMNQGGMMYSDIMNRPMFQTPQQRQGLGIMAGVAPVRGYEEGGMATPEYTPKFMREEDAEEDGLGRMLFEFFIVDPDDPVDVGLASASAAMVAGGITAPGAVATQLARMGYKGKKLFDAVKKIESLGKPSNPDAGIVRRATAPVTGTIGATMTAREIPEIPSYIEAAGGIGDLVRDAVMKDEAQGYAMGGIAQLSNGGLAERIMALLPKKAQQAVEILDKGIDAGRVTLDDIFDAVRKGDISSKDADALIVKAQQAKPKVDDVYPGDVPVGTPKMRPEDLEAPSITPKMTADDIATPPESAIPTPPKPPATGKAVDDAAGDAKKPITQRVRQSVPGQVVSGALKPITSPIRVGAPVAAGAYALNQLIESGKIQEAMDMAMNNPTVKSLIDAGKPAYEAVTEFFGPIGDALFPDTGERVELTESVQARLPEVEKARKEGFPEPPTDAKKDDETGTPVPEATGIMKFLFGKDGIGGDPGAVGKAMDYLADPRTRYALARAAESRPGVVDRNFFTDFTLGQAEYDQLQGKDETALMQNYEFLKQAGKSDDEIFNLLLSKDTASDIAKTLEDRVYSLFGDIDANPKYIGLSTEEKLAEARRLVYGGGSLDAPAADSDVVQTVDLE